MTIIPSSWTLFLLGILTIAGCAGHGRKEQEYHTLSPTAHRDGERADKLNSRGVELMDDGKWTEAEQAIKKALAADTLHGPAHNNLGKIYYHQRRYYLAAWEFQYAIKLMPNQPAPRNNLGLVYEAAGKLEEAEAQYDQATALEPDSSEYLANLARAKVRRGQRDQDLREVLEKLVMRETRPQWQDWAREQLARFGSNRDNDRPTTRRSDVP